MKDVRSFSGKKGYRRVIFSFCILFTLFCHTACGKQEISFGREAFFMVKEAEEMNFAKAEEYPVQAVVGKSLAWTLTGNSKDGVYEREIDTGVTRSLECRQEEQEMIMGISAVDDTLYVSVSCGETVQVRKFLGDNWWEAVATIPREEAPEQIRPSLLFVDRAENSYFVNGDEIWQYSPGSGQRTIYKTGEPAVFLQEKKPGTVEAVTESNREIALYTLKEEGHAEPKWAINLSVGRLTAIQTDDTDTMVLAADSRVLLVNNATGEITAYFDSIAAGVSTNLLGGLLLTEEGVMYLVERTADSGGIWEKLTAQSGPEGDRTVLVYGTVYLSETMKERIVSFNKNNPDYYITVKEYDGETISDKRLQMQAAVTSGHGPDILDLYTYCVVNYRAYAEKGYLEDLEPYLLGEEFHDDIIWPLQELYRVDGGIYMALPHFTMQGLAVNPQYAPEADDWNLETFMELARSARGELHIIESGTAHSIFAQIIRGMQGEFLDLEKRKAYFDTPEFVSFLELCRECGKRSSAKDRADDDITDYADKVMLVPFYIQDPSLYLWAHAWYGEDAPVYGYPIGTGQVFLVNNAADACGINAQSENKEGAWEFLRTLFSEDYQRDMTGYGSAWAVRESCWYALWDRYQDGITINGTYAAPATEEEIKRLADRIVNGNIAADMMDSTIFELIMEEADAYFEGDRTAEEAAGNIQNRVQLMLEE